MAADFDVLGFTRRLEGVGFTRAQAEALAEEQARLIDDRLATKADIAAVNRAIEQLRSDLTRDIEQLRADLARDIEQLRADLAREIGQLRSDVTREIAQIRSDLARDLELLRRDVVIRLGGIVIASVAAGSAAVTLFSRLH